MLKIHTRYGKITSVTSPVTLTTAQYGFTILVDTDTVAADSSITIPADWAAGQTIFVKNTGTGAPTPYTLTITSLGTGPVFYLGAVSSTSVVLNPGEYARIECLSLTTTQHHFSYQTSQYLSRFDFGRHLGLAECDMLLDVSGLDINVVSGVLTDVYLTLPAITDTLVGRVTTDTLQNKTLVAPIISGGMTITGDVGITGNLTVTGTTTRINTVTLTTIDNAIVVASANVANLVDAGWYMPYNDGTARYRGCAFDHTDNTLKTFTTITNPDLSTTTIDFATQTNFQCLNAVIVDDIIKDTFVITIPGTAEGLAGADTITYLNLAQTCTNKTLNGGTNYVDQAQLRLATTDVVATPYNITVANHLIEVDAATAGGPVTVNLPAIAAGLAGKEFIVRKQDAGANTVTIVPNGADTIDGIAGNIVLNNQWDRARIVLPSATGTNWSTF